MNYLNYINNLIKEKVIENNLVIYGQNIDKGSCLSGLLKGIKVNTNSLIINTPNSENLLTGMGFGLMKEGVSSIFFMKQLDFLMLGVDHLVNTYNFFRSKNPAGSFTIFPIVVDIGFQGMQSSFNNFSDLCSLARIDGYSINNKHDADDIINNQMVKNGFRIISVSQRLFNTEIIDLEKDSFIENNQGCTYKYSDGDDLTIVCFNFSFPHGYELKRRIEKKGCSVALFSCNFIEKHDWSMIYSSLKKTGKLIMIDDSKSLNQVCFRLESELNKDLDFQSLIINKSISKEWFHPNDEKLIIDYDKIIERLL